MRVTIDPRKHVATVVVSAAIALSVLLLVVATVGGAAPDDDDKAQRQTAEPATPESGVVNPWAAGDAAVLRELAELGRAHLNGCP